MNLTHTSDSVCYVTQGTTIYKCIFIEKSSGDITLGFSFIERRLMMLGIKIFIFLWILIGAIFCLYALFTEKGKKLVNDSPLLETAIAIMYAMILSPYWLISGIIETLFKKG